MSATNKGRTEVSQIACRPSSNLVITTRHALSFLPFRRRCGLTRRRVVFCSTGRPPSRLERSMVLQLFVPQSSLFSSLSPLFYDKAAGMVRSRPSSQRTTFGLNKRSQNILCCLCGAFSGVSELLACQIVVRSCEGRAGIRAIGRLDSRCSSLDLFLAFTGYSSEPGAILPGSTSQRRRTKTFEIHSGLPHSADLKSLCTREDVVMCSLGAGRVGSGMKSYRCDWASSTLSFRISLHWLEGEPFQFHDSVRPRDSFDTLAAILTSHHLFPSHCPLS